MTRKQSKISELGSYEYILSCRNSILGDNRSMKSGALVYRLKS
jgi:hypothetical protein